jgi:hypothetical protein
MGFGQGVAGKTLPVYLFEGHALKRIDLGPVASVDVGFTGSMTGFTTLIFPALAVADFEYLVRILAEGLEEVLVAGAASGRTHIAVSGRGWRSRFGG